MKKLFAVLTVLILASCMYAQDIKGYGISFRAKGQANEDIKVRIKDAEDEEFEGYDYLTYHYQWDTKTVPFTEMERKADTKGNGIIDFPLRSITVEPTDTRTYYAKAKIDDIHSVGLTEEKTDMKFLALGVHNLQFVLSSDKPGNLFYFGEKPKAKLTLTNCILPRVKCRIKFSYSDESGNPIQGKVTETDWDSKNPITFELPDRKGFCRVHWEAVFENGMTKTGHSSYGVIPDNRKIALGKASQFGVNTHFNHGKPPFLADIINRLGISWIRDQETSPYGKAYEIAKSHNLQLFMTFSWLSQESLAFLKEEFRKGKTCDDEFDFSPYIQKYGQCAEKFGDWVDYYDIQNEPDGAGWLAFGGEYDRGPWIKLETNWQKQVSDLIRKKDPGCKIVWEDMHMLCYDDMLDMGIRNDFDYISPHPYSFHRVNPLPENQGYHEKYAKLKEDKEKYGLDWKVIEGEVGVSDFILNEKSNVVYTPTPIDLGAAILVRIFVMHLSEDVEKVFWFKFEDTFGDAPNDAEAHFGIVYIDGTPKPAACAYANMLHILEGCSWDGRIYPEYTLADRVIPEKPDRTKMLGYPQYMPLDESEDNIPRFFTFTDRNKNKGMVCWIPEGSALVTFDTGAPKVRITDLYGNEKTLKTDNGKITLKMNPYPFYLFPKK